MKRPESGSIVVVDWRGGSPAREPNRLRPAVVVEAHHLFPDEYRSVFVAPLTRDEALAHPAFAVVIKPSMANGCIERCWVLANYAGAVSLARVRTTASSITNDELWHVRYKIALMIGFPRVSPLVLEMASTSAREAGTRGLTPTAAGERRAAATAPARRR